MPQEQQTSGTGPAVPSPAGVPGAVVPAGAGSPAGGAAAGSPADGAAEVVEWGDERAQQPGRSPRWLSALVHDRRVVPLAAALGGVALFASLISEWQVTVVDGTAFGEGQVGQRPVAVGVGGLGAWGSGYLVGLLLLVASMVLMLFGAPAIRAYARLAALSTGGVLLALLAGVLYDLDSDSLVFSPAEALFVESATVSLASGRGGYCAVAGVLAILLAAALAGRHLRTGAVAGPGGAVPVTAPGDDEPDADRPWRRPRDSGDDDDAPDAPFELSVSSAEPFTPLRDAHDTYRRPGAISG